MSLRNQLVKKLVHVLKQIFMLISVQKSLCRKMSHQKLISNYFKEPSGQKRKHDEMENDSIAVSTCNKSDKCSSDGKSAMNKKNEIRSCDIGPTWFEALASEFNKSKFKELSKFVEEERKKFTVYPPEKYVYEWTRHSKINEVKVVILGQDPYHGPNQAHGLAFSVAKGVDIPKSLRNIYEELKKDIPEFKKPSHGCLTGWADQGVLLLNTVLTVRASSANSHKKKGWEDFTDAVIKWISQNLSNVVFILWGDNAKVKSSLICEKKHLILTAPHPSPLSAYRGFFGCQHFSKANSYLKKFHMTPIDWKYLP